MDDTQRIVKCGNLSLLVPGGFFKKRWHGRYLVLYDGSKSGVKRLELFESEIKFKKQNPAKIIALVDCVRVVTCQRQKTTYTFEVRTSDQFYLLAAQSFQDMNDWVNCLRLVAFGQPPAAVLSGNLNPPRDKRPLPNTKIVAPKPLDVLLEPRATPPQPPVDTHPALQQVNGQQQQHQGLTTASQAVAAAASALAKTRQRQPSLLGACKPQPPTDSPFIRTSAASGGLVARLAAVTQPSALDTLTPTVRGQLIAASRQDLSCPVTTTITRTATAARIPSALDEEEENMLYCSIEDNPSEHNYRVKVIETELSLRCQLKCYQLTTPNTVSQQYEQLGQFQTSNSKLELNQQHVVTFYQLIVGPQELTLLNDYQALRFQQQSAQHQNQHPQGLWSWPYQCIRRYGFDKDNCFMFEAGRKCSSGPGQFVVQTPKAYGIYQDVVKFVNELRSLGGTAADQQALATVAASAEQPTVTQIPVTWAAPSSPHIVQLGSIVGEAAAQVDSTKRQFFDTLRQLDAGGIGASSTDPSSNQAANSNKNNTTPSVASEETDESGYEQGDESVDSSSKGSSRARCVGATNGSNAGGNLRKRQQVDSMSSASSTSSSGAGSPGQSVSRLGTKIGGLNLISGGHVQTKRTPLTTTTTTNNIIINNNNNNNQPNKTTANASKQQPPPGKGKLGTMLNELVSDQPEDFEANLIRDVYSEITKLHAKFAVATSAGSAEDSMSSRGHSSQEEEDEDADEDEEDAAIMEPMYSNLGRMGTGSNNDLNKVVVKNPKAQIDMKMNNRHRAQQRPKNIDPRYSQEHPTKPHHHHNPQSHHQQEPLDPYLSSPPRAIYPTILNPIPECGEPTTATTNCQSKTQRPRESDHMGQNSKRISSNYTRGFNNKSTNETNNNGRLKPQSQQPSSSSSSSNGLIRSKLPTNHYVINDVQYAKISRNLYSKYESCL